MLPLIRLRVSDSEGRGTACTDTQHTCDRSTTRTILQTRRLKSAIRSALVKSTLAALQILETSCSLAERRQSIVGHSPLPMSV